ncbi:MAG: hypothetical protein RLZZ524_451 [Pseudomonadota bacterium]|jgi:hypothetical protein
MAHITADRVLESTTTSGTGALTLAGALTGFRAFSGIATVGDTCWYAVWAVDANGNATGEYEEGLGTYSAASTLTRTTVLLSSNANALVSFAAGTKYVALALLAPRTLQLDNQLAATFPAAPSNPAAAAADTLKMYARKIAGRMTPKYIGPSGVDQFIQDKISTNRTAIYFPNGGTTVGLNLGVNWTTGGTVSHPTPSSTAPAIYNQQVRTRWTNVATTQNQTLGLHTVTAQKSFWRGNAAGLGGFNFHARFAIGLWPAATVRLFVGLSDQNTSPVASDTLAGNCCGLWHDTTEAASVLNFVTRNGTTATKAAITLAANLAAGQCFDFYMWSAPNGSAIFYRLDELNTGTTLVDTSTTTTIPLNTAFMGPTLQMSNGTANTTVTTSAFELMAFSCQSDN